MALSGCGLGLDFEPPTDSGTGMDSSVHADGGGVPECTTDQDCDDGRVCNGAEACSPGGRCVDGTAPTCDDGIACTDDRCEESAGGCVFAPDHGACESVGCQVGRCVEGTGCRKEPDPTLCDDSIACTIDICNDDGACAREPDPTTCAVGEICTTAGCRLPPDCTTVSQCPGQGACRVPVECQEGRCIYDDAPDGHVCGSDPCVDARCMGGLCRRPIAVDCTDDNPCTSDACLRDANGPVSCPHDPLVGATCDDGDPCTLPGLCSGTTCQAGGPVCTPGDLCNRNVCSSGTCLVVAQVCGTNASCNPSTGECGCDLGFEDCDGDGECECPTAAGSASCIGATCARIADAGPDSGSATTPDGSITTCLAGRLDCDGNGTCECNSLTSFCNISGSSPVCQTRMTCTQVCTTQVCCPCNGRCCTAGDTTCCPCVAG